MRKSDDFVPAAARRASYGPVVDLLRHTPNSSPLLRAAVALLAAAMSAGSAPAQELRPTFCRVVDADGEPVAGASVTFAGGLPHLSRSLQAPHVVEGTSDARGRVVARLQRGLCYVAWARGPNENGARLRAKAVGYFAAGAMVVLRCLERELPPTLRLEGEEAWADVGPLRCFAVTSTPGAERELTRNADGAFEAPGSPFDRFEVCLSDGRPLWSTRLGLQMALPPPQRVKVRVVDERGGALQGAQVWHRVGRRSSWTVDGLRSAGQDRMRLLGSTDEEGRCEVVVPYDGDPLRDPGEDMLLFVSAGDRPAVAGGVWGERFYVSDHRVGEIEGDELRFECTSVEPLRGAIPGAPAGTVAHLAAICKLHLQRNSYLHDARTFTAQVGADGTFTFEGVPKELHSSWLTFRAPAGEAWLPPVYPAEASRALPPDVVERVGTTAPLGFGEAKVQVLDAMGGPARGAIALVAAADHRGVLLRDSVLRVPLDERGQATRRLAPGSWVVVVVTDSGFGGEELKIAAAGGELEMQLQPLGKKSVVVRDARGAPVVGARVRSRGSSTRGTRDALRSILQGLRILTRTKWDALRTDADGRVQIPYLPIEGVVQRVELYWDGGSSEQVELVGDEEATVRESEARRR